MHATKTLWVALTSAILAEAAEFNAGEDRQGAPIFTETPDRADGSLNRSTPTSLPKLK